MRYDFLDWLRAIAVFALLLFHTGMLFVGWAWHITNAETIPALELPMSLAHRLRMPLLFLIAGAGMWYALKRRTGVQLAAERTLRLLVPLMVGMLVIVPPQVYVERVSRGAFQGGYLDFLSERVFQFQPYPAGDFSWHHLWFIAYLYVYVLLLLPLLIWWRRTERQLRPGAWLFLLALPLGANGALLQPLYPETHSLLDDWYIFNHYLLLTIYGFTLAALRDGWDWLAAHRRALLAAATTFTVLAMAAPMTEGGARGTPASALISNFFTWSWLLVFLGFGRQHLSFRNRLLEWARHSSYPIYIFHQTVIILVAYFVLRLPWTPWTKYWVVLVGTIVASVALYELARRFAVTRLMFGIKGATSHTVRPDASDPIRP